jgi:hypothetical protein
MNTSPLARGPNEIVPCPTGYKAFEPTLCMGLDIAWFGGSKGDPYSQYDCLVSAVTKVGQKTTLQFDRIKLVGRDPDAAQIAGAIANRVVSACDVRRVLLAIDAPLETAQEIPTAGRKAYRGCERHFIECRKSIDRAAGGSSGWHPNVQPGVPLAPRIKELLKRLQGDNFKLWSEENSEYKELVIECFPAEAIWAAKRLGHYANSLTAFTAKAYKNQNGISLSEAQVRKCVDDAIRDAFAFVSCEWRRLVDQLLARMLEDATWQRGELYRGGKLLDDVVDSMISFSTALSYANGEAHVWQHRERQDDGHIIGPGSFTH